MRTLLPLLLAPALFAQETSEVPLALNLPTAAALEGGDFAIRFTHRFSEATQTGSHELYGLDGFAYAGFGFDVSTRAVSGLNFQAYRTADSKTVTLALQQRLWSGERFGASLRAERFDETIPSTTTFGIHQGLVGAAVQMPLDLKAGPLTFRAVPTWISRTRTEPDGVRTAGLGLQWDVTAEDGAFAEFYPRPSQLADNYRTGWAAGYQRRTKGHRFTILGTNVQGTTAHQVLGGDYYGGPRPRSGWALGFNLARIF